MENAAAKIPKYELAGFMASPEAEAFAAGIAAEWSLSEECARARKNTPPDDRRYVGACADSFREWLRRKIRESRIG